MHVLIIEDNSDNIANLNGYLGPLGYTLDVACSGAMGFTCTIDSAHDVVVLVLSLPGIDGLKVYRLLREEHRLVTSILMLTARDTVKDNTLPGFWAGADDYLVKAYALAELHAGLTVPLRRSRRETMKHVLAYNELCLDTSTFQVTRPGRVFSAIPTCYKILAALMRSALKLIPRELLKREAWEDDPPDSDALGTHIHALRQVVDKPFSKTLLVTMAGCGYRPNASE